MNIVSLLFLVPSRKEIKGKFLNEKENNNNLKLKKGCSSNLEKEV